MGTYEVLFIVSAKLTEDEVSAAISEFRGVGTDAGMTLVNEDAWGKRRLAYPIQKTNEGIYHLFVFEGEGAGLSEMDRRMKNSDAIMRHMIVRTDLETRRAKKLAIKNAKPEKVAPPAPAPAAPAEEAAAPAEAAPAPAVESAAPAAEPAAAPTEETAAAPTEETAAPAAEQTAETKSE